MLLNITYNLLFMTRSTIYYTSLAKIYYKVYSDTKEVEMKRASSRYCQHVNGNNVGNTNQENEHKRLNLITKETRTTSKLKTIINRYLDAFANKLDVNTHNLL